MLDIKTIKRTEGGNLYNVETKGTFGEIYTELGRIMLAVPTGDILSTSESERQARLDAHCEQLAILTSNVIGLLQRTYGDRKDNLSIAEYLKELYGTKGE